MASRELLSEYENLNQAGFHLKMRVGDIIARGFSDIGYEEYSVVPGEKAVSVFTGSTVNLEGESIHFFKLATVDEMTEGIISAGYQISRLEFPEQREWRLVIQNSGEQEEYISSSIQSVFIQALTEVYRRKND